MKDLTVSVPDGTIDHGVENLICVPPRGYDLIVFFCVNYLAHVFTAIHPPGATFRERLINALYVMFVPGSGITRALRSIICHARRYSGLESAARAGALCMVLRKENIGSGTRSRWFNNVFFNGDNPRLVPTNRSVHGITSLPHSDGMEQDFFLAEVPPGTPLQGLQEELSAIPSPRLAGLKRFISLVLRRWGMSNLSRDLESSSNSEFATSPISPTQRHPATVDLQDYILGNNWNPFTLAASLLQAGIGVYTLYKARGDQMETYGFTAFGLTVVPYVFMAFINIIASLVTPQFPCMFLIKTPDMQDAQIQDGHEFGTFIAEINPEHRDTKVRLDFLDNGGYRRKLYEALLMFLFLAPLGITVALSHSHLCVPGVRLDQVVFVSLWQISSAISPWWLRWVTWRMSGSISQHNSSWKDRHFYKWLLTWLLQTVPVFAPAIGGMYYVALMITEYGSCTKLDYTRF